MGKASVLFVVFFSALLIYAKYREEPPRTEMPKLNQPEQEKKRIIRMKRVIRMKVTGYCPCKQCCGKFADGLTTTGKNAWETLGVAADPRLLPYGTSLVIPRIGIRTVDDTGGAMKKSAQKGIYHIDVRFHSHEEAKKFGVKELDVVILSPAEN